jgi:uncharacterized membrane protein
MRRSLRAQALAAVAVLALLVLSIAQGAFRDWTMWDYIGWWVLLPLAVLLPVALVVFLVRAVGKRD